MTMLASLFEAPAAAAKTPSGPVARRDDQPRWQDPASGYLRRNVSLQLDGPTMFHNPTRKPARYAVVIASESPSR